MTCLPQLSLCLGLFKSGVLRQEFRGQATSGMESPKMCPWAFGAFSSLENLMRVKGVEKEGRERGRGMGSFKACRGKLEVPIEHTVCK